jgi:hypothetical protein
MPGTPSSNASIYSSIAAGAVGNIGCGCLIAAEYKLQMLLLADAQLRRHDHRAMADSTRTQ